MWWVCVGDVCLLFTEKLGLAAAMEGIWRVFVPGFFRVQRST
jgi:hypothetical protein